MKRQPRRSRTPRVRTTRARRKGIGTWEAQCRDCKTKFRVLWGTKPKFCIACKSQDLDIKASRLTAQERADRDARIVNAGIRLAMLFLEAFGIPIPTPPRTLPTMTREEAAQFIAQHAGYSADWRIASMEDPELLDAAYKKAARRLHPDAGGSHEQFVKLQQAKGVLAR